MGQRRRAREYALQMLFQVDLTAGDLDEVFASFWENRDAAETTREFAQGLVRGVLAGRDLLDRVILASATNWRLDRMAVVDRNVLRLAVHEMLQQEDELPPAVVIDEAIEIARKYGSDDSSAFINGVLDDVKRRVERGEIDPS